MPIVESFFAGHKAYRIRVFDEKEKELVATGQIKGIAQKESSMDPSMETLGLSEQEGKIRLKTQSPLLFVQVEYCSGVLTRGFDEVIGRCQIHRLDPRSSQVWPYQLSESDGTPVNCGIELKAEEDTGIPPLSWGPPKSSASAPGSGRTSMGPLQDMDHGVSAMIEFERAIDMPRPTNEDLRQLLLTIKSTEKKERELRKAGPFAVKKQANEARLCRADCTKTRVFVQAEQC